MSHLVTIQTQIRDKAALAAACTRLKLAAPVEGTAQLYASSATGQIVQLPGWRYPIVIDLTTAAVHYDNFNQAWGQQSCLDQLLQAYAVEKARIEARRNGHRISEQLLNDGSIQLTLSVGGAW